MQHLPRGKKLQHLVALGFTKRNITSGGERAEAFKTNNGEDQEAALLIILEYSSSPRGSTQGELVTALQKSLHLLKRRILCALNQTGQQLATGSGLIKYFTLNPQESPPQDVATSANSDGFQEIFNTHRLSTTIAWWNVYVQT